MDQKTTAATAAPSIFTRMKTAAGEVIAPLTRAVTEEEALQKKLNQAREKREAAEALQAELKKRTDNLAAIAEDRRLAIDDPLAFAFAQTGSPVCETRNLFFSNLEALRKKREDLESEVVKRMRGQRITEIDPVGFPETCHGNMRHEAPIHAQLVHVTTLLAALESSETHETLLGRAQEWSAERAKELTTQLKTDYRDHEKWCHANSLPAPPALTLN